MEVVAFLIFGCVLTQGLQIIIRNYFEKYEKRKEILRLLINTSQCPSAPMLVNSTTFEKSSAEKAEYIIVEKVKKERKNIITHEM